MMRAFGYRARHLPQVDIACVLGEPCARCERPIAAADVGVVMPYVNADGEADGVVPWHLDCLCEALGVPGPELGS